MKRLGKVLHYAKQGLLIVRSTWIPSLNDPVIDKDLKLVGIVKDVFGPVKMPYVAIKPKVENPEKYVGQVLYIDEKRKKRKKEKKKMRKRHRS
ncbi:Gar1/Naf1 family protein [Pyrococcus horikoshii]|uniref:H/ACA RNA-protein complex protein Gar1 n=1 Tax=Pyrococcus horikoshii TaxID=53953 RepID=A0A832W799_PYRHR|nr:Gar1/Naf1 family protein [Pyrococcus horikoshii]HII60708.1 H/ACA RNA-protein complex protein Gar1 [Pyrococcus horikoshii]